MFKYKRNLKQRCFLCNRKAVTGDHIPPKGLYPKSMRGSYELLTVPACKEHNESTKLEDEYFRAVMSITSYRSNAVKKLFNEHIEPRIRETGRTALYFDLFKFATPQYFRMNTGIWQPGYQLLINDSRIQVVFNKIAHGLFWRHNGKRIPSKYGVTNYVLNRELDAETVKVISGLKIFRAGNPEIFEYRYGAAKEDFNSVYIAMLFYKSVFAEVLISKIMK